MKKITADMLLIKGGCMDQVELVRKLWPDGVTVSVRTLAKARKAGLSVWWLSSNMLDGAARVKYYKAIAPARAEYDKALDAAFVAAWANQTE